MLTEDVFHAFEDALFGDDPEPADGGVPIVSDRAHADRILRRVDQHRRRAAQVVEIARIETERIAEWLHAELVMIAAAEMREVARATSYHRMEHAQDDTVLTIRLPNGKLVSRDQQPEWEFTPAFVTWALEHLPAALHEPPPPPARTVDRTAAKRLLTQEETDEKGRLVRRVFGIAEGGAVPAGVTVVERERKFDVSTDTPRPKELEKVVEVLERQQLAAALADDDVDRPGPAIALVPEEA